MYKGNTSTRGRLLQGLEETGLLYVLPAFGLATVITLGLWASSDDKPTESATFVDLPAVHEPVTTRVPAGEAPSLTTSSAALREDKPRLSLRPALARRAEPEDVEDPSRNNVDPDPDTAADTHLFLPGSSHILESDRDYMSPANQAVRPEPFQGVAGPLAGEASERVRAVQGLRAELQRRKTEAWAEATARDWSPVGAFDENSGFELMALDREQLYVYATDNAMAALSTAADLARLAPGGLSGQGVTLGIWDQGAALDTHVELAGRTTVRDGSYPVNHATHAAGTLAAAGQDPQAKGMAPDAWLDTYDWTEDLAEVAERAMRAPGEAGTLQISSHSYGFLAGWATQYSPPRWFGRIEESEAYNFGLYEWYASTWDDICHQAPYYLPFKSAGNNRLDQAPAPGATFKYYDNGWQTGVYDPDTDPAGDGEVEAGYDTIPVVGNAKNMMTVGAVYDASQDGLRAPAAADMTTYSGWGPTDDGRIKPDIVANGSLLYSCSAAGDEAYTYMSGTSMATPNAAGSAALILEHYGNLFPGSYLRASTLKGLILHTADDLGRPGPDYVYGWGLMNTRAAVDLLTLHAETPGDGLLREATLHNGATDRYTFRFAGEGAVKVTACWTDPAGAESYALDDRTPRLVNDLDLRVIDPEGRVHFPFRLDPEHPARDAERGDNLVDNVEQVLIEGAAGPGEYVVEVTSKGNLQDGAQVYALIVSGLDALSTPPDLAVSDRIDGGADGDGIITLYGEVTVDEPAICALQVEFSADAGATWAAAQLAGASSAYGALRVDHDYEAQVRDLAVADAMAFAVHWDTQGGRYPIAFSESTLVRIRALNGTAASAWRVSPLILVDNQGPYVDEAILFVEDLAFSRYVIEGSVLFSWSGIHDQGTGLGGYLYAADNDDPSQATFTTATEAAVRGLAYGSEHTIYLWALDAAGNLSEAMDFRILAVPPYGYWDGASEPDAYIPERGGDTLYPEAYAAQIQADEVGGVQILRWPFKFGTVYDLQYTTDPDGLEGWTTWDHARFTLDQDGWVVWVDELSPPGNDPGTVYSFRVLSQDFGRFINTKPDDLYTKRFPGPARRK